MPEINLGSIHWVIDTRSEDKPERMVTIRPLSVTRAENMCGRATLVWEVVKWADRFDPKQVSILSLQIRIYLSYEICARFTFSNVTGGRTSVLLIPTHYVFPWNPRAIFSISCRPVRSGFIPTGTWRSGENEIRLWRAFARVSSRIRSINRKAIISNILMRKLSERIISCVLRKYPENFRWKLLTMIKGYSLVSMPSS